MSKKMKIIITIVILLIIFIFIHPFLYKHNKKYKKKYKEVIYEINDWKGLASFLYFQEKNSFKFKLKGCSQSIPFRNISWRCYDLKDYLNIGDCFENINQLDLKKILKDPNCCQQFDDYEKSYNDLDYLCYSEFGRQIDDRSECDVIRSKEGIESCRWFFDHKNNKN